MKSKNTYLKRMALGLPLVAFFLMFAVPSEAKDSAIVKVTVHADYSNTFAPSNASLIIKLYSQNANCDWILVATLKGKKKAANGRQTFFKLSSSNFRLPIGPADLLLNAKGVVEVKRGSYRSCYALSGKQTEKVKIRDGINEFAFDMDLNDRRIDCPQPQ